MAIDSAEKRKSISGIHMNICPGVTPNSGKDQEWRQESGFGYSGILAGSPVAPPVSTFQVRIVYGKAQGNRGEREYTAPFPRRFAIAFSRLRILTGTVYAR